MLRQGSGESYGIVCKIRHCTGLLADWQFDGIYFDASTCSFYKLGKASDAHEGMSYMWTVYSLVGIGLLVGTGVNILIRFCIRL